MPDSPHLKLPTPVLVRGVRLTRAVLHIFHGVALTTLIFPFAGHGSKQRMVQRWSRNLLRILSVDLEHTGLQAGMPDRVLIVANHISWLDIFVLNALQPSRFIAKSELRRWPVVGRMVAGCGTLFIERGRRHDTHKVNRRAAAALSSGDVIAIFPEGTTTDGRNVLPFHGSLLQPVVDAGGHVQPIAIRYLKASGEHNDAPAYVGETSFMESFWCVTGERMLVVELHVAAPLPARARHRRELSRAAEAAIRTALASPAGGRGPGTPGDRGA